MIFRPISGEKRWYDKRANEVDQALIEAVDGRNFLENRPAKLEKLREG
jgi:hypothetical protein